MYAIVDIAGQQFKVEKGNYVYAHRLDAKEEADEIANTLLDRARNTLEYYGRNKDAANGSDGAQIKRMALYTLDSMRRTYQSNGMKEKAQEAEQLLRTYM